MYHRPIKIGFALVLVLSVTSILKAQPATGGYSDPAQQYNLITRERFSNSYTLIGGYKVKGNPYLYGGNNEGMIYFKSEGTKKGKISYNTYNQQLEFEEAEGSKADLRDVGTVDSFTIAVSSEFYKGELKFVNGNRWDIKNKFFVQKVLDTTIYNLYKRFYSTLEIVTTNYVQSELRQFELGYDYYYSGNTSSGLIKLKTNEAGLKKEFTTKKNCFSSLDFSTISSDKENFLKSFFLSLTHCK